MLESVAARRTAEAKLRSPNTGGFTKTSESLRNWAFRNHT